MRLENKRERPRVRGRDGKREESKRRICERSWYVGHVTVISPTYDQEEEEEEEKKNGRLLGGGNSDIYIYIYIERFQEGFA